MSAASARWLLCPLLAVLCLACARRDGEVVARVGGSDISREELDQAQEHLSGGVAIDAQTRRKILDSLVLNRALALTQEQQLTGSERQVIAASMQAHRDQVLARMYLAGHGGASAPTDAEVLAYYERHATQFGGGVERHYEMVLATGAPGGAQREAVLAALGEMKTDKNWDAVVARQVRQGLPLAYRQGIASESMLHERLRSVIEGMHKSEPAQLTLVDGHAYLVRVTEEAPRTPQPLAQVRHGIEQALAAQHLKQALDAAAPEVLKQMKVEYLEPGTS